MRKFFFLAIPIFLIFLFGVTFLLINLHLPSAWQAELDQYIMFKNATSAENYRVQSVIRANRPWNFTKEMSLLSIGNSAAYQTDFRYGEESFTHNTLSMNLEEFLDGSLIPLPYPPKELWCVFLKQEKPSERYHSSEGLMIIIVARHQDLYNADFVIHEIVSESSDELNNHIFTAVDCRFP